ncbi:hypothetical protein P171DRAFT_420097, partial [Karstenula rhodostoma CBS 690.94]
MTHTNQLPVSLRLFIATPNAIYAHSSAAPKRTLFEGTSDGIVNARAAKDNSSLLAVADSQLVILHDPARRGDRKYALKNYEGEPRLLVFSPDSRTLYFTTTLSTSIQAYCIPTGELLPPPQIHPSPPTILSISWDGNILLSASSAPPKICLQDLRFGGSASVSFQPADTKTYAVFATFQRYEGTNPSCTSFLLGFQDGTLSIYRLVLPTRRQSYHSVYLNQTQAFLQPTRVGCIKKLHKPAMGGVTAAEFIPGYKARTVSHVDGPATCLAVISCRPVVSRGRSDRDILLGIDSTREEALGTYEGRETFIAIGCNTGTVLIYNVIGLMVHKVDMNAPVVALDWLGDMSAPSVLPRNRSLPACIEQEDEERPALSSIFAYVGTSSSEEPEEEYGTVKRKVPSPERSGARSPIRFDGGRDLFSPGPEASCLGRRKSEILIRSPTHSDAALEPVKRRSFLRPRIATETFKDPSMSSIPRRSLPAAPTS